MSEFLVQTIETDSNKKKYKVPKNLTKDMQGFYR